MAIKKAKLLLKLKDLTYINSSLRTTASKPYSNLVIKKIGSITCIGLNRPDQKNCLNVNLMKELLEGIELFENDKTSNAAVLYGERGNFCYGYDSDEFRESSTMIDQIEKIGLLKKYPLKPIVSAIAGFATGPGFDLALWTDFRIMEDTALMGGYARRFGMPASDIIIQRMYSLLGIHKAMDLVLTGRIMNSKEALESGIASRVVACGTGLGQAVNFANSLSNMPQACLRADRAALISLSSKYPRETKEFILEEMERQRHLAIEEANVGLHITESGDVRNKT